MMIFPHEQEPSPIKTVDSLFFSRSEITNVLLEDADRKVMIKRILSFLFVEKESYQPGKLTSMSSTKFSSRQNVCSVLKCMQPIQQSLWIISRYIFHIIAKEITLSKGNLCSYKCFIDVFFILTLALKKIEKWASIWVGFSVEHKPKWVITTWRRIGHEFVVNGE